MFNILEISNLVEKSDSALHASYIGCAQLPMLVWLVHKSGSTEAGLGWRVGWREGGGSAFARAGKFLRLAVPPLPGNLTAPTKARRTAVHYKT